MNVIDENGFLAGKIEAWASQHRAHYDELFSLCENLNRACHQFLDDHSVGTFDSKQLTTMVLFVRLLELYQGVMVHVSRGLRSPSRIVFRSFLEAYFHFEAIQGDPDYLSDYLNQFEVERKSLVNRIRRTTDASFANLRKPIDAELIAEIEAIKFQRITIEEVAKRGGRYAIYATAYALLSRSVHSSAGDLEDHLALDGESKEIVGFRYGPSDAETVRTLGLAGITLTEVLEQIGRSFGENVSPAVEPFKQSFEAVLAASHPRP
jgi:hypothetical protein